MFHSSRILAAAIFAFAGFTTSPTASAADPTFTAPTQFTTGGTTVVRVIASQKLPVLDGGNMDTGADKRIAVDLDGDGNPDLLQADAASKLINIRRGQGDGTFVSFGFTTTDTPSDVAVADLNHDGLPDLVVAAGGSVLVYLNTCDTNPATNPGHTMTFAPPVTLTAQDAGTNTLTLTCVALPDLDGDGHADIVAGASTGDGNATPFKAQVAVFMNLAPSPGNFGAPNVFVGAGGADFIAGADLSGDGKPEVIVAKAGPAGSSPTFTVFKNNGTGTLNTEGDATPPAKTDVFDALAILGLAVGDIDADGKRDVLIYEKDNFSSPTKTEVAIHGYQNDGSGTSFANLGTLKTASVDAQVAVDGDITLADLNGDGQPEIIVADALHGGAAVIVVNAALTHSNQILTTNTPLTFPTDTGARRIDVGDVDEDTMLDLFVANTGTNNASLLLNTTGSSTSSLAISMNASSTSDPALGLVVRAGDTLSYFINVTNNGAQTAKALEVTDALPLYLSAKDNLHKIILSIASLHDITVAGSLLGKLDPITPATPKDDAGKPIRTIRWKIGDLAPGATKTVGFTIRITKDFRLNSSVANTLYAVASSTGVPATGADGATAPLQSAVKQTFSLTATATPTTVAPGAIITYTVLFKNLSAQALTGISVAEAIPANTFFVDANADNGGVKPSAAPLLDSQGQIIVPGNEFENTPTQVIWTISNLKAGKTATLTLRVAAKGDLPPAAMTTITHTILSGFYKVSGTKFYLSNFDAGGAPSQVTATGASVNPPPKLALGKAVIDDPGTATDNVSIETGNEGLQRVSAAIGSQVTLLLYFHNGGGSPATGCYVKDRIPEGTSFVVGSARMNFPGQPVRNKNFLGPDKTTLVMPLPDLPVNGAGYVTYRVKLERPLTDGTVMHSVGAAIGAANLNATPGSIPADVPVSVRGKPAMIVERHSDHSNLLRTDASLPAPGYKKYFVFYANTGSADAKNVVITDDVPAGTTFFRAVLLAGNPDGQPGAERAAGTGESITQPAVGATGAVTYHLGTVKHGKGGWVQLEVLETADALNDPANDITDHPQIGFDQPASLAPRPVTGPSAPSLAAQFKISGEDFGATAKLDPNIVQPFVGVVAPLAVPQNGNLTFRVVFGNLTNVNGAPGRVNFHFTHGSFPYVSAIAGYGVDSVDAPTVNFPDDVFLNFNQLPPHAAGWATITLQVDPAFAGKTVKFGTGDDPADMGLDISTSNGRHVVLERLGIYVFPHDAAGDVNADFNAARSQIALAAVAGLGADTTQALADLSFTDRTTHVTPGSTHFACAGADTLPLDNGATVVPLLGSKVLVVGPDGVISNDGGSIISHDGGTLVGTGLGSEFLISNIPNFTSVTAAGALTQAVEIELARAGNIHNVGAGNLIGHDGASLVDNTVASLITSDGAGFLGQTGANLIGHDSASFTSLTAAAANSEINLRLISERGGGIVTDQGAGFSLVATRGGSMFTVGGGVVIRNAGQIVTENGSGLSSNLGSKAASFTANGNFVSGGGNLVIRTR